MKELVKEQNHIAIIAYELKDEITADYDNKLELWELVAKTEFSAYTQTLYYEVGEGDVVIIYVKL